MGPRDVIVVLGLDVSRSSFSKLIGFFYKGTPVACNDQEEIEIFELMKLTGMKLNVMSEGLPSSPSSEWRPLQYFLAKSIE